MEQKLLEAYGRGTTSFEDLISGKPYEAEYTTLGMPGAAYMDYLLTSDPQNINYKYRKEDPYYDPQFDMPRDPNEIQKLSPLNMYYQRELQRQKQAGLPESEWIQSGQVMGMPGAIPTGTTGTMPSRYESYADALARTKAAMGLRSGGRVGYAIGSPEKQMEAGAPTIIYEGNMDPRARNQRAGLPPRPRPMQMAAHGGRIGYRFGLGPMAQAGLPGIPRMAEDGLEYDMSQNGGFQPLGAQEGKDDVKANLAKNEFVFTADAVRAAGGGSIQKGAQRMYDTMKKLESRVA